MSEDHLARYEPLRRREQAILGRLLDLLQRIDHAPPEYVEQVRDALFHADNPFLIVLIGPFGAGKSSVINALVGEPVLEVGPTPTTTRITILRHGPAKQEVRTGHNVYTLFHPAPILQRVSFVDTPGLESVFKVHDEITRRFLHRADVVFLVMLATQALSAGSLDNLVALRDYGKPVLILANQADLLEPADADTVRRFIEEECKRQLGLVPQAWLVSARAAHEASAPRRPADPAWRESGLDAVMTYIDQSLSDEDRIRGKLRTTLQIGQHIARQTLELVQADQQGLGDHQSAVQNIRAQIGNAMDAQQRIADRLAELAGVAFDQAAERGAQTIGHMFRIGAALGLLRRGLAELVGLSRFARRLTAGHYAGQAFEQRQVSQPLQELDAEISKLAPRLEGNDLQGLDRLVSYGRAQVERLPATLRDKVIGRVEAPAAYQRGHLQEAQADLRRIIRDATAIKGERLELAVRNSLLLLAAWEVLVVAVTLLLRLFGVIQPEDGPVILLIVVMLVLAGFAWMPLQAIRMSNHYTGRLARSRDDFQQTLAAAIRLHLDYARQLREDAVQPYTRLVETQAAQLVELRGELAEVQQELASAEQTLQSL
jgi:GTP-binding protein EngB required for normal cell division